jgi:hypothetical protein
MALDAFKPGDRVELVCVTIAFGEIRRRKAGLGTTPLRHPLSIFASQVERLGSRSSLRCSFLIVALRCSGVARN